MRQHRVVPRGRKLCVGIKAVVFIVFLLCFLYQSAEFYMQYYTYPVSTNIDVKYPKQYPLPAFTACANSPIRRSVFCARFSDLCQRPYNISDFCKKQPRFCKKNVSLLQIPKLGYHADSRKDEIAEKVSELVEYQGENILEYVGLYEMKTIYVQDDYLDTSVQCLSLNLRSHSGSEPMLVPTDPNRRLINFQKSIMILEEEETFYPWMTPQVFVAIHSSFNPLNPFWEQVGLKVGYEYHLIIRGEEEHLLNHPYPTNCTDYDKVWKENGKTGPRSIEMCLEMCIFRAMKECGGCDMLTVYQRIDNKCREDVLIDCHMNDEYIKNQGHCFKDCLPDCRTITYPYTIKKREADPNAEAEIGKRFIVVYLSFKSDGIKSVAQKPLYETGDLFSYIGGLIGCWLGISAWAFTGIIESVFLETRRFMHKLKKRVRPPAMIFSTSKLHPNIQQKSIIKTM